VRKKMLKPEIVSDEDDIKVFTTFIKESERKYYRLLQTSKTCVNYENLCEAARGNHNYTSFSVLASLSEHERESYSALNLFLVPGNEVAGDSGNQSAWIYEAGDLSPSPRPAFKCRVSGIITSQFVVIAPRDVVTLVSARLR
ncbi:hypothetical protein J6590_106958, partial [Homalodisca vitripennis]